MDNEVFSLSGSMVTLEMQGICEKMTARREDAK